MNDTLNQTRKTAGFGDGLRGLAKKNTMALALVVVVILIEILLRLTIQGEGSKTLFIFSCSPRHGNIVTVAVKSSLESDNA